MARITRVEIEGVTVQERQFDQVSLDATVAEHPREERRLKPGRRRLVKSDVDDRRWHRMTGRTRDVTWLSPRRGKGQSVKPSAGGSLKSLGTAMKSGERFALRNTEPGIGIRPAARTIAVLLHSLDAGGAQLRTVTLINRFAALGRRVELLVVQEGGALASSVAPAIGVTFLDRKSDWPSGRVTRSGYRRRIEDGLVTALDRLRPDAFVSGAMATHNLATRAHQRTPSIPLLLRASSHPIRPLDWLNPGESVRELVRRASRRRQYAQADAIIAVAEDVARGVRRLVPGSHIDIIHNPVITARFLAGAERSVTLPWSVGNDSPLIVSTGRLTSAKDFPTLLRAFAIVRAARKVRLAIAGGGSAADAKSLGILSRRLGVQADFALLGHCDSVAALLRQASVFVSSSIWEGLQRPSSRRSRWAVPWLRPIAPEDRARSFRMAGSDNSSDREIRVPLPLQSSISLSR